MAGFCITQPFLGHLLRITATGLTAGNTGEIVPCGRTSLPAVMIVVVMMVMMIMLLGYSGTPHRAAALSHARAVVIAVPVPLTAVIAAPGTSAVPSPTVLAASAGQQQQDNQTIHTLCFLSVFVTLSYAANTLL